MMNMIKALIKYRSKAFYIVAVMMTLFVAQQSSFAAVSDPQIISNMAIGEYTEEGSTVVQVTRSNLVQTTILPVYSLTLVAATTKTVVAGQTIYFSHTLTNTGNMPDQYNFTVSNNTGDNFDFDSSSLKVYLDTNYDGIPDGSAVTNYTLAAGQSVGLIVAATVPNTVTSGQNAKLTLLASSQKDNTQSSSNIDIANVTSGAAVVVRKKFSQVSAANGDIATVRLDYQNPSNTATASVTLTDTLDSSLSYQSNAGENWNGTEVNPATGANDPAGIDYSYDAPTKKITAIISSIPANSIGYIEFKVQVNKSTAGQISNIVNVTGTGLTTDTTNTAVINVAPVYAVKMNASASNVSDSTNPIIASAVSQGGTLSFTNYVWNTGNTTDRFNLSFSNSTFPAGSQIEFYRADGVTPLLDSNGDGIADTGLIAAGANVAVIVKVRFPSSYTVPSNTSYNLTLKAQSISDATKTSTIVDQGSLKSVVPMVDLTNSPENTNNGLGNGAIDNNGVAWKTLIAKSSNNPTAGGQAIFPLKISHTGVGTEYLLSANGNVDFTNMALPAGVNRVRFYMSSNGNDCSILGTEIGRTRYLNDGESQLVCAIVEVDKVNNDVTVPVYFRVLATSFIGTGNPSQDTLKNAVTIQSLNAKSKVEFTPDLRGQVAPLGTVIYSHLLINHGDSDFTGSYNFMMNNDQTVFNSTLFYDTNGNGKLDGGDLIIRSLADLPNGKLVAHGQVKLLLQVTNTASNNATQNNTTVVNLTDSTNQVVASITDVTTVNKAQLSLTKLQARDFNCDGIADEAYTNNTLSIGKQPNGQGQCVLYKVILTNSGATMNKVFTFRDMTPFYTVLSQAPICTACSGVTAPTVGNSGELTGTLNNVVSGQSYEFNFGVRYVGQ